MNMTQVFATVAMILGACFYAMIFGSVVSLVKHFDVAKSTYYERMDWLHSQMQVMGLSSTLR
jgi:hypothetical protein